MSSQNKVLDFTGHKFFLGLDVHKSSFHVTIRSNGIVLKSFSMDSDPCQLIGYMHKHYPGGMYYSVYEAGFSGFWIHEQLVASGFVNQVINPADVPTTSKEKVRKTDRMDSRKLARELENGSLQGIYIPDAFHQQLRSLTRLRVRGVASQTRVKNRIKGHLAFYGIKLPSSAEMGSWSGAFIRWLESLSFTHPSGKDYLDLCIEELREHKLRQAKIIKRLRSYSRSDQRAPVMDYLLSVPGIGFITAITLYAELMDIHRFKTLDHLACFVGLVPAMHSSGDTDADLGLCHRHSRHLRAALIESAWIAVRKDPALTLVFGKLIRRMSKQKAIIRIAKKLLSRIRFVWKNQQRYVCAVIE